MAIDIDDIRLIIRAELADAKKELRDLGKTGKKQADDLKTAFESAFKLIGASKALRGIKNLFAGAIDTANRFEVALLGVKAAAEASGQPFEEVRKRVLQLTEDGVLGIENVANSFKLLLSQGVQADEAFELTNAVKQIASLNNIVGSASIATQDFFKGILTGSVELIENADPAIRGLIKQVGGLAKVTTDAATRQKFFNLIIERGTSLNKSYGEFLETGAAATARFEQATEQLNATLGNTIKEAFAPLLNIASSAINTFKEFFEGLSSGARSALIFGSALTVLIPLIGGVASALNNLAGGIGIFAKLVSLLGGPVTLAITAVIAAFTGLIILVDVFTDSTEKLITSVKKEVSELRKLGKELKALEGKKKLNSQETAKLKKLEGELAKAALAAGIAIRDETGALRERLDVVKELTALEIKRLSVSRERLEIELFKRIRFILLQAERSLENIGERTTLTLEQISDVLFGIIPLTEEMAQEFRKFGLTVEADNVSIQILRSEITGLSNAIEELEEPVKNFGKTTTTTFEDVGDDIKKVKDSFKGITDFLKTELQIAIEGVNKRFDDFQESIVEAFERGKISGEEFFKLLEEGEDKAKDLESALRDVALAAQIDVARQAVGQIGGIVSGAREGGAAGFQQVLGGAAGLAALVPGGQAVAAGLGVFGAVVGVIDSLIDSEEELKRQAEERRQQLIEQNRLIESQRAIEEALVNLARERSQLLTREANRQLRINALLIENEEERRQADLAVLQRLAQTRAQEFAPGVDVIEAPEQAIGRLSEIENKRIAVENVLNLLPGVAAITPRTTPEQISARISQLEGLKSTPDLPSNVKSLLDNLITNLQNAKVKAEELLKPVEFGPLDFFTGESTQIIQTRTQNFNQAIASVGAVSEDIVRSLERSSAFLENQVAAGDELIGLLEQIEQREQKAKQAQFRVSLAEGRQVSFIDIGRRGVRDITGQFIGAARPALTLPSTFGGLEVATQRTKSFQERQAEALENSLAELKAQTALLASIAASVGQNGGEAGQTQLISLLETIAEGAIK